MKQDGGREQQTCDLSTHSGLFDSQGFRHCCRSIARYFPLCLSFRRCIFETKLVVNTVGGHQNFVAQSLYLILYTIETYKN